MPEMKTLYAVIKIEVEITDSTPLEDVADLLASECDYSIAIEPNSTVKVVNTTLEYLNEEMPS